MVGKKFFSLFLLATLPAVFAAGVSTQTEQLKANASEVPALVKVNASVSFNQLIPGQEYSAPVAVEWAVPRQSLANIADKTVVIYARVEPASEDSWVYFKPDGKTRTRSVLLKLECVIEQGDCGKASVLSRTATAFYAAPFNATYPHEDGLKISASLVDLAQSDQFEAHQIEAKSRLASAEEKIEVLAQSAVANSSFGASASAELEKLAAQARVLLAEKKLDELAQKMDDLEKKLEGQLALARETDEEKEALAQDAAQTVQKPEPYASWATGLATGTVYSAGAVALITLALLGYAVWSGRKNNRQSPHKQLHARQEETSFSAGAADEHGGEAATRSGVDTSNGSEGKKFSDGGEPGDPWAR